MGYLGTKPQTATTLADNIVTADKIVSGAVTDAKIAAMAATKLTGTVPDANAPSGSVIQVVNATYATSTSRTSSTYADTGLTASITPSSVTSKILVMVIHSGCRKDSSTTTLQTRLLRNSTVLSNIDNNGGSTGTSNTNNFGASAINYLDSPATTSSVTYKTQFASSFNTATVYVNDSSSSDSVSTITLMEIAA